MCTPTTLPPTRTDSYLPGTRFLKKKEKNLEPYPLNHLLRKVSLLLFWSRLVHAALAMHATLAALGTICQATPALCPCEPRRPCGEMQAVPCGAPSDTAFFFLFPFFQLSIKSFGGWVKITLKLPHFHVGYQIRVVFRFNPQSRCNSSSRCCYRAREHVDPAWSGRIRHGGDSHPEILSSPGSVGLARAHPPTKTQATEPSRQTWSNCGPPYPFRRWSSAAPGSSSQPRSAQIRFVRTYNTVILRSISLF